MERTIQTTNYGPNAPGNYQKFFVPTIGRPLAENLIAVAGLHQGERILDIACGTGVVTRMAAEHTGPNGRVAGLDANPGMLEVARSSTPDSQIIEWIEADAQSLPLEDGTFDVVFCQMGLQFISNKISALREMHRVLAPQGRICINLPGPKPQVFAIMTDAIASHLGQEGATFIDLVFSMHDSNELNDLCKKAGFNDITITSEKKRLDAPSPCEFLWQYIHSTPLAPLAASAEERIRGAIERDTLEEWQNFATESGMQFEVGMTTVSAAR